MEVKFEGQGMHGFAQRYMIDDEMDFCFVLKFWPSFCIFILASRYTSRPCLSVCLSVSFHLDYSTYNAMF